MPVADLTKCLGTDFEEASTVWRVSLLLLGLGSSKNLFEQHFEEFFVLPGELIGSD